MNEVMDMDDVDEFLADVLPRQRQADLALLGGDSGPRKMLWSHKDPVTVLGAAKTVSGWLEVESLVLKELKDWQKVTSDQRKKLSGR